MLLSVMKLKPLVIIMMVVSVITEANVYPQYVLATNVFLLVKQMLLLVNSQTLVSALIIQNVLHNIANLTHVHLLVMVKL